MKISPSLLALAASTGLLGGCLAQSVPERLPAYIGLNKPESVQPLPFDLPNEKIKAGLIVINDTTDSHSAPGLSEAVLADLTEKLKEQIEHNFPISIVNVFPAQRVSPDGSPKPFQNLAKEENLPYVMLAILSSSETEIPDQLPLQGFQQGSGARGRVLGFRTENYALVELALLDGNSGRPLVHSNGRAWSVLERLNVPIESNVYPVVRRDQTIAPIYPTEEAAYDTLRGVSAADALRQALMHFIEAWDEKRPT